MHSLGSTRLAHAAVVFYIAIFAGNNCDFKALIVTFTDSRANGLLVNGLNPRVSIVRDRLGESSS